MSLPPSTVATLRFTPGFRPGMTPPTGPDDLLDGLLRAVRAPAVVDAAEDRRLWREIREFRDQRRRARRLGERTEALEDEQRDLARRVRLVQLRQVGRAVAAPDGLGERMARFWAGHFSVSISNRAHAAFVAAFEDQAIRPHMAGRFADMLTAAVRHPAMLVYLDQHRSFGPNSRAGLRRGAGLNENLGRELLELHTLGADGPYAQTDVHSLALLLTGFTVRGGEGVYRRAWSEPGAFEVLGRRYRGGGPRGALRALEDLSVHPATARHLSWKLARHFVADAPPEALVAALARTWTETGGDLLRVTERLVSHPDAWGPLGAKVRQPQELVVAALRAAGAEEEGLDRGGRYGQRLTLRAMHDMDQGPGRAPGPDGWPEAAERWITPGALAKRLEWATSMGAALARDHDPRAYAREALREALSKETAWAVSAAAEKREGFALLLASPDFNRR
jgi:uncharacterized protein (DUF1800 family)